MVSRTSNRWDAKRLGSYLRSLRLQNGWTQNQAGEEVGVDAVTIRRWELGLFSPSINRIESVASVYGVDVSALINAAESGVHGDSVLIVPVKGFLNAGNNPPTETDHLGTVSLPLHMNEGGQNAYCLLVTGDTLVPDGVHDGDVLLVDPDQIAEIGSLCVVELDRSLRAGTFISSGRVNVRTRIGAMIEMEVATDELIGTVVWHIRRM
ncbi:MAG: helix-turn-helix domain-containing protein [Chloroflexi bacterium]|nr:helix-turn-helix domain-containing protein [Chloroflexota bacterium]